MPFTSKEIKNIYSKRREEYKYAIQNEEKGYKAVEEKVKYKEKLQELKEKLLKERTQTNTKQASIDDIHSKLTDIDDKIYGLQGAYEQDNQKKENENLTITELEKEIILNLRKLSKIKQEYFYHLIRAEVLKKEE